MVDLTFKCRKCGSDKYTLRGKGPHIGMYCAECDTWEKWLGKSERDKLKKKLEGYENPTRSIF
jgi:hypothetical protein